MFVNGPENDPGECFGPCSGGRYFAWNEAGKVVVVLAGNYAHGVVGVGEGCDDYIYDFGDVIICG